MLGSFARLRDRWRRIGKQPGGALTIPKIQDDSRGNRLEKVNEDLRAAQAELQRQWKYLAEAQRLSHSGTFGWKVNSGKLDWSEETYRILGFTREMNPTLDLVFDRIHPDDRERWRRLRDLATKDGMDLDDEHRLLMPDGTLKYVHVVAHAGIDESGNREYIGVIKDITDRKRAEEERQTLSRELEESNARLEEAQRVAHVGHWEWDLETGVVVWSDETYRIFGLRPQERPMDLPTVRGMVHPDDRESLYSGVDVDLLAGGHPVAEFRIVLPSGELRTVHAITSKRWSAISDGLNQKTSQRHYKLFGTIQDITERKRSDEERHSLSRKLEESNARLEEAQRVAHLGYWIWDLETNRVIFSNETCRIYGLKPQEDPIDLETIRELIHPEDREYVFENADRAVRDRVPVQTEHRLIRPNGEVRIVYSRGDLTSDASGRPYQMFGTCQDITQRKRAEEERQSLSIDLQGSKTRLEEAQRVAHIGHYEFDPVENQVTWSAELCRIWGIPPATGPIDMAVVFEMVHPEDRENAVRAVEEIIRNGTHLKTEHRIVRPDGEVRFLQVLGTVKRDASGRAYELFGTGQDITDRKLAEQALRRNQFYLSEGERLAHMGSWASRDLGFRWSDDLSFYWSDEVYKIYGLDPKDGTPNLQQYLAAIHPQDRTSMTETVKAMHEQHCGCDVTKRIIRPDGEIRYVRWVGIPVVEDEVFRGFHGTTMDVTEQELLTRELRREQAYFSDAQGMAHIGSWGYNLITQKLLHSSDENARLYGFDPSQGPIPAERFFATQHAEDAPLVNAVLERAVREGTDFYLDEYRIHHTDGSIRFLRAIGHRNATGEPGEYVGVTMDITERKRAEEERERLRQLEAELEHINRVNMMGELAAALAHEIKQPIAASITSANALLRWLAHDPPDLERARATATRIEEDGNRAADVINSLQSFFRRGTPAKRQRVDLKEIIEEMTGLLRAEADRYSIRIESELHADIPNFLANRVQLQQVLLNLMLNAIEAMRDTGGELTIRAQANEDGKLLVSVSDTGVGLLAENSEQIFAPFHTTKSQGTGMGLTITRSIVESYGGRVWATVNQGAGASFHFTLPGETEGPV